MPRPQPRKSPTVTVVQAANETAVNDTPYTSKFVRRSGDDPLRGFTIILNGVEGAGKTVTAATIDPDFPAVLPAKEPVYLKKVFFITIDGSALAAFPSLGLEVSYFDLPAYIYEHQKEPDPVAGLKMAVTEAAAWLKENPNGSIVTDSLSTLADILFTSFDDEKNAPRTYKNIAETLRRYYHQLVATRPRSIIFISHLKAESDITMGSQEERQIQLENKQAVRDAGKLLDGASIGLDLTASAMKVFKRAAPLGLNVEVKFNARTKVRERILNTKKTLSGIEVKNKFEHLLNAQEPSNLHALMTKIEEGSK